MVGPIVTATGGAISTLIASVTVATIVAALAIALHFEMDCKFNPFDLDEICNPSSSLEDRKLYSNLSKYIFWFSWIILIPVIMTVIAAATGSIRMK